jgi:putative transposase
LYEAKKRYGLCVLNYIATSNHIHLLVVDTEEGVIPRSLQLIAGRTAQEFNTRKKRKGAFWEDRYHATAVETGEHLAQCLVYIDLNMVRAGVVNHPSQYSVSGYNEIQNPPGRYAVIDEQALLDYLSIQEPARLREEHRQWVASELEAYKAGRSDLWSSSIAVGSENFVKEVQHKLSVRGQGRTLISEGDRSALREPQACYNSFFKDEMGPLRAENSYFLDINVVFSTC